MRIGIISDIHGPLPKSVARVLTGCDAILCAGDMEDESTLPALEAIAPTTAVRGNVDVDGGLYPELPTLATVDLGGIRFLVTHSYGDALPTPPDVDAIVYGHTHIRHNIRNSAGTLCINPGSIVRTHDGTNPSCVIAQVENGTITSVEFVDV